MKTLNKNTRKDLLRVFHVRHLIVFCLFIFVAFSPSSSVFADGEEGGGVKPEDGQCKDPDRPILVGPISICDLVEKEATYYVDNHDPWAGATYTWYITGGSIIVDNGDNVVVVWGGSPPYELTVWMNNCVTTIYLQDCECEVPEGATEVINLSDMDHLDGNGDPILADIMGILDPGGANSGIVIPGGGFPDFIVISSVKLFFRGVFDMKKTPILFRDCEIIMDKGTKVFTPNLIGGFQQMYSDCYIHGACDYMWHGIILRQEGHFTMEKCEMQDAEYGITINTKNHINLVENYFYMNYVTLYGPPNSHGNTVYGNIEANNWDGSMTLVPGRYNGQSWVGQWAPNGLDPLPADDLTFTAIEMWDLGQGITYPLPFNISSAPNYFHDLNLGIWCRDSYMDVYNCSFENILDNGAYYYYGSFNGSGVYAITDPNINPTEVHIGNDPGSSNPYPNLFKNTTRDIYLEENLDSWIDGNSEYGSIRVIEIANSNSHSHTIIHNYIEDTRYGIFSNVNELSNINIHSNTIATVNGSSLYLRAIEILDGTSNTCVADVFDNIVTSYSTIGIWGLQNQGSTYRNNFLYMDSYYLSSGVLDLYGIVLQNGANNTVRCNEVTGVISPANVWMNRKLRCYLFGHETNLTVLDNSAHHAWAGFEYYLVNTGPFAGNTMATLGNGLVLGEPTGTHSMSNQTLYGGMLPGNIFSGPFNTAATHSIASTGPTMWVGGGAYYPNPNINTVSGAAFNVLGTLGVSTYTGPACTSPGGAGHGGHGEIIVVPQTGDDAAQTVIVKRNHTQPKDEKLVSSPVGELDETYELANSCPAGNEKEVYAARAIVINKSNKIGLFFDDMMLCAGKLTRERNPDMNTNISATLYPNPATNTISVTMDAGNFVAGELQIFNLVGVKVMSEKVDVINQLNDVDLSKLSNGLYVCHYVSRESDLNLGKLSIIK